MLDTILITTIETFNQGLDSLTPYVLQLKSNYMWMKALLVLVGWYIILHI